MAHMKSPKVAVIGAGISGISAAHNLIKHGFTNVTIFEALDRIGGRIHSQYYDSSDGLPPYRLEMGAQWIHGTRNNPVFDLARTHKGLLQQPDGWPKFQRSDWMDLSIDGDKVPSGLFRDVCKWFSDVMKKCEAEFDAESPPSPETDRSIEAALREAFPEFLAQRPVKDHDLCEQILNHRLFFEATLSGCDNMTQVSCNQSGSYVTFAGSDPEIPCGYTQLVRHIAENIPDQNIKLKSPIAKISYNKALTNTGRIELTLDDGQTEPFDHVIVTASINILKKHHESLFEPLLDSSKVSALGRTAMGTVDKIFLQFPDLDFLSPSSRNIRFLWPVNEEKNDWTKHLHAFYVINTPNQDILTAWLTGDAAEEMEKLSDEDVIEGCLSVLRRLLKNPNVPQPVRVIRSRWGSEPSILGSYSYIPVGGSVHDIMELAKPITQLNTQMPLIQFAGEGTHPEFYSTTHGALLSGRREASTLMQYYSNIKQPSAAALQ